MALPIPAAPAVISTLKPGLRESEALSVMVYLRSGVRPETLRCGQGGVKKPVVLASRPCIGVFWRPGPCRPREET